MGWPERHVIKQTPSFTEKCLDGHTDNHVRSPLSLPGGTPASAKQEWEPRLPGQGRGSVRPRPPRGAHLGAGPSGPGQMAGGSPVLQRLSRRINFPPVVSKCGRIKSELLPVTCDSRHAAPPAHAIFLPPPSPATLAPGRPPATGPLHTLLPLPGAVFLPVVRWLLLTVQFSGLRVKTLPCPLRSHTSIAPVLVPS